MKITRERIEFPRIFAASIEERTLQAAGLRREDYARVTVATIPEEARSLAREILSAPRKFVPVGALALGFEFDARRLKIDELLRRLIARSFLSDFGAKETLFSAVAYKSRPRWDLYSPDLEMIVALNHLVTETDVIAHLTNKHSRVVLWSPAPSDDGPDDYWHFLRYRAIEPWAPVRNWFEEVARQNDQQSREKRQLQIEAYGLERDVVRFRTLADRLKESLDEASLFTLIEGSD